MPQKLKKKLQKQGVSSRVNGFWSRNTVSFWCKRADSIRKSTFVLKRTRLSQVIKMSDICIFQRFLDFILIILIFKSVIFDAACPEGTRGIENHTFENPPEANL